MNSSFSIGSNRIGPGQPVFVIAEVGVNHGGDAELCARMIAAAAAAGANAVKLQIIDADASYVEGTASYAEFRDKGLEDDALAELMNLGQRLGVVLFSTPGDFESLERIVRLGMPAIKISSGLMTNLPLVGRAAATGLPLIVSTGLAYENEIDMLLETARSRAASAISLLKCTALYPSPDDSLNLAAIGTMASRYGVPIGYSDHTLDDLACVSAVACGATVIEKHFTLDRKMPRADHHISMEPPEFTAMVRRIRRVTTMLGAAAIRPTAAEISVRSERHRCLVARVDIEAGDGFSEANIALKRPLPGRSGLPAAAYASVLGRKARSAIRRNEPILESHLGDPGSKRLASKDPK